MSAKLEKPGHGALTETCCICLKKCYFLENINENHGTNNVKHIEKLQVCVPNEAWEEDVNLCTDCIENLDSAYEFVQTCLKSEEYRKERRTSKVIKNENEVVFECDMCGKSFRLKRTLKLHLTRMHSEGGKRELRFEDKANFVENNKTVHDIETSEIKAEIVKQSVTELTDILQNEECFNHADDVVNGNSSSSETEPEIDFKKVSKKTKKVRKKRDPFKCEYCGLIFKRRCRFLEHVRSKHTYEKPFKCDLCDAAYYSNSKLSIHKRKHTNEKPYVCTICGKCFASNNDLWMHNKIHNDDRPYHCDGCEKSFKTPNNLRVHKRQMHLDKSLWKHVCNQCGKRFPINSTLIKHIRRHEGIRLYGCHLCDKRFVDKTNMQSHLLTHSNEKLHKCKLCTKEYKKKETLKKHLKRDHDIGNIVLKKPEKNITCPMCPKAFSYNTKLQRHLLTHTGEKPVKCDHCEKRFRDNYDRNVHCRKEHSLEMAAAENQNNFY